MAGMGDEIRRLRRVQRLTQEQLAEMTGNFVTQTDVSQLERGHRGRTSPEKVRALAKALGVPYNHLAQLNFDLDVEGGRDTPASADEALRDELWEDFAAQHPDLLASLRRLRDANTRETYEQARRIIRRHLASGVETARDVIDPPSPPRSRPVR